MGKLKRKNPTQQTKWEKSSKAIGISLTLIQLANMYSPIIPRAGAEAMPSEYSSSSENNTDSVNNDVYGTPSVEANPTFRLQSSEISSSSGISLIDFRPTSSGLTSLIPTLGMSFSKQVQLGTGAISIYRSNDKNKVEEIKVSSGRMEGATYNLSGSTLQIYTNDTLPDQTEYYVNVDPRVIIDENGVPFSGVTGENTWTFRTPDFTAPKASFESNYNSGVSRPIWLKMQFDESIHKRYGSIIIRNAADDSIAMKMSTSGGSFLTESGQPVFSFIDENAFHFQTQGLNSGTAYYVDVTSGTFSDDSSNTFPGIQGSQGWSFKTVSTVDTTNPSLISHGASEDSLAPTLYLTFDEVVELGNGAITIYRADNDQAVENLIVSGGHISSATYNQYSGARSIRIETQTLLDDETEYYVSIAPNTFKDTAGNSFSGYSGKDWIIRTPDRTAPKASYATTYPEQQGDPVKLKLFFNEDVKVNNYGSVIIREVADNNAVMTMYAYSGHFNASSGSLYLNQSGNTFYFEAYGLNSGVEYYVDIQSGTFVDQAGNGFGRFTNAKEWSFKTSTTIDTRNPSLISHGASEDSLAPTLYLTFDEVVELGNGAITIYRADNDQAVENLIVSGGHISSATYNQYSGARSIRIETQTSLDDETEYYVSIAPNTFKDTAGNSFSGYSGKDWIIRTPDRTAPKASYVTTYPEQQGEPVKLKLFFNEDVKVNNYGSVIIREVADNNAVMTMYAYSGHFNASSGSLYLNQSGNTFYFEAYGLNSGVEYYVDIQSGTFVDQAGNGFGRFTNAKDWSFKTSTTIDTRNPSLISHGASEDSLAPTLYLTFDEVVELGNGAITIYRADNDQAVENLIVSGGHISSATYNQYSGARSIRIETQTLLDDETEYYVSIAPNTFKDTAGNSFSGYSEKDWIIRTPDRTAPKASYATTYPEQQGEPVKLKLFFNEDVKVNNYGSVIIREVADNNAVMTMYAYSGHFNASSGSLYLNQSGNTFYFEAYGLNSGVEYYVDIQSGTFVDQAGNEFEGFPPNAKEWTFQTVDHPPILQSYGETGEIDTLTPKLNLLFNESVEMNQGSIDIYRNSDDTLVERLNITSGQGMGADYQTYSGGRVWNIQTSQVLDDQTDYYVSITPGAFKDKTGHDFSGVIGKNWIFRTPDRTAPEAKFSTNYNSGVGAPIWIGLEFNEQVRPSTGNIIIRNEATGEKEMVIQTSSGYFYNEAGEGVFSYEDNNRFYLQTQGLNSGATYYVDMSSGMFVDIAGNVSKPVYNSDDWSFTISNYAKGDIVSLSYGILENQVIRNLPVQLKAGELLRGLTLTPNAYALVYNSNGSPVNSATVITTGMQVKVWSTNGTSKSYSLEVEKSTSKKSDSDKKTGNNQPSTPVSFAPTSPVSSTPVPTATGGSGGAQPQATTGNSSNNGTSSVPSTTNPSSGNSAPVITSSPNVLVIVAPLQAVADTVSLQANSPSTNALVYYYDNNWDKWIAVPTTRENNNLKASVPQGAWTSVIANSNMAQPQDTINSWANKDILKLMSLDIVQGDAAGSYNPQQAVNRYEMAVMLAKVLRLDIPTVSVASVTTDNSAMPAWAEPYVQAVSAQGIMVGDNNGFNGTRSITREQLATMIGRMLPTSTTTTLSPVDYKDAKKVSAWATQGVQKMNTLGLMSGYPDQTFRPNQEVTREEMAAVLSKLVDILSS
ncbi:Ig-like domain-containing protein [Paenibacillus nuruki]|uniref:Ig-like domain-containing protein n=1 Tax=Paenibacillus nuruki TaxID=1886670 RepID=UPI002805C1B3|nr:Ig-like domain-containing protein [Paenibacillus nuruki]CAJ1316441.1 Endo-1,4-beta-xylanase [Paenibacillus nuruki]